MQPPGSDSNQSQTSDQVAELDSRLRSGSLTRERLRIAAFFGDPAARVLMATATPWPPPDVHVLYTWGWNEMQELGKQACVRAALAAYEAGASRRNENDYERQARWSVEDWVIDPSDANRKHAGRAASVHLPHYSDARTLANLAGARHRWKQAVGFTVAGNPHATTPEQFLAICDSLPADLVPWALGSFDPVARRRDRERSPSLTSNR